MSFALRSIAAIKYSGEMKVMLRLRALSLVLATTFASYAMPSQAAVLLATGELNGVADLSGLTGKLENGLNANILGGMGSGLAWAGGSTFIATPDRGPNATPYNSAIDDTSNYISRFHTVTLSLNASANGNLPYTLTPTLNSTTLLWSANALNYGAGGKPDTTGLTNTAGRNYFTGRSDAFAAGSSTNPNNGRFDPEGVRVSADGKSVFISDEYGPYVYQFDRATGERIKSFELPKSLAVATLGATTNAEAANVSGRVANKGMEGLAISPDGKTLVGMMQAPLLQDKAGNLRIVTIDVATGATKQFAYKLTDGSGVSEITAINDHEFLVDERDGKGLGDGSAAKVKKVYKVDISAAQAIPDNASGDLAAFMVNKTPTATLDLVTLLTKPIAEGGAGLTKAEVSAKIEGLAFGEDVLYKGSLLHTLYVANDNDFVPGVAGGNKFYVFGLSSAELGGHYQAQNVAVAPVPEPETYALMGMGLLGLTLARRRRHR